VGLFRPIIVLPEREYPTEQLIGILQHELTHLRRFDVFVKWLSILACVLHWFNPLVWLARREINRACELSCDAAVIRPMCAEEKMHYGHTLIALAADPIHSRTILSAAMYERKDVLKQRLQSIGSFKQHTKISSLFSALILAAAVFLACLVGASTAAYGQDSQNTSGRDGSAILENGRLEDSTPQGDGTNGTEQEGSPSEDSSLPEDNDADKKTESDSDHKKTQSHDPAQRPQPQSAVVEKAGSDYRITVRGKNFSPNAVIDLRRFYGDSLITLEGNQLTRTVENGLDVIRFTLTDDNLKKSLSEGQIMLWVRNPDGTIDNIFNQVPLYITTNRNTIAVTYDCKTNGSATEEVLKKITAGTQADLSLTAEKKGSTFKGWNTDPDAAEGLPSPYIPSSNVLLFAIFG
jgi:hypothetical protein